ncbi:hypothetical protein [Histidinibacterium aquaticum]|uniref:Uncharacterized protein n=1 Tax=Histidinibacterium aquaticum TaxID=2613962 RepID=A0A5J5GJR4_9RHOB|nr:hypothetical protein [Histidinibacterium aquaticum]KAA9008310.1 hypothetical protein F3S47_12545 [Histidinibacterium aquaticum]
MQTSSVFLALAVAGFAGLAGANSASAQSLSDVGGPQPAPPAGYEGGQYIDSRGCAFVRAGIGGATNWIPRVNRERQPLCGFQPTNTPGPRAPAAPEPRIVTEADAPAPAETPVRQVAETPPAPTAAPRVVETAAQSAAPSRPSPQINRVTPDGQPVSVPAEAPRRFAGLPAPGPDGAIRVSRQTICARIETTGESFLNRTTGQPVVCDTDPAPQVVRAPAPTVVQAPAPQPTAPVAPSAPVTAGQAGSPVPQPAAPAATCPGLSAEAISYLARIGAPVDCAPWSGVSVAGDIPASNPPGEVRVATRNVFFTAAPEAGQPVSVANPVAIARSIPAPPPGYQRVWEDGRINPYRGYVRPF